MNPLIAKFEKALHRPCRKEDPFRFDRFGLLECEIPAGYKFNVFKPPQESSEDYLKAAEERAVALDGCAVAWSGGVDSTLLLALFMSVGAKVTPVFFTDAGDLPETELSVFVRQHFPLQVMQTSDWTGDIITGGAADVMWNSVARPIGSTRHWWGSDGKHYRLYRDIPRIPAADYVWEILQDEDLYRMYNSYVSAMYLKMEDNLDVLRMVNLCFNFYRYTLDNIISRRLGSNAETFYNTQKFTDICFTQYWKRQCLPVPAPKEKEVKYIAKVFGKDFGVVKNGDW
ncbi:MAG: hypothetical protein IJ181_03405 [Acidaminococcaceae bacterium]|nr:hypothetical protein [Acidaminococcaceae bacterium]